MMSKLIFILVFAIGLSGLAQSSDCNIKIQGGDYFPWSNAKPFPWSDIQGVWKLTDDIAPLYLKAKVVRSTTNRKILSLSIVSEGNCSRPVAQGVGYVDFSERNVVRAMLNDGSSKYQMKLASFDVRDLEMDSFTCGQNIMAASLQMIGSAGPGSGPSSYATERTDGPHNIMLKKVSNDLTSICKKLGTR